MSLKFFVAPVVMLLSIALPMAAFAQGEQKGTKELEEAYSRIVNQRTRWMQGTDKPTAKDAKDLETIAQWFAHRPTWVTIQSDSAKLDKIVYGFEYDFVRPCMSSANNNNSEFVKQMGPHFVKAFKEVLDLDFLPNRQAVVNVALMLPSLAKLKQEEVGDMLKDLITDPKVHDAIKLHAIRALREFFPIKTLDDADLVNEKKIADKKKRDLERIAALKTFIERKWPTPQDKMDEDTIHYLRREAIQSLAAAGAPALGALKAQNKVEGAVAYELAKILTKGAIEPELSLGEKCEAAIGLLNLKCANSPHYDPRISLYIAGKFLKEYVAEYRHDFLNLGGKKVANSKQPWIAWKTQSDRLKKALDEMRETAKSRDFMAREDVKALENSVKHLADAAVPLLTDIGKYQLVNNTVELDAVVNSLRPTTEAMFLRIPGPKLKVAE